MDLIRGIALAVVVLCAVGLLAILFARRAWSRTVESLGRTVLAGAHTTHPLDVGGAPEPVTRYLARALPEGRPHAETASFTQAGTFQMREGERGWRPFTAKQSVRIHPPAFFWDARINVAPGVSAFVRDSYVSREAQMVGKVLGLMTVVDEANSPQLASGALARYLAEAVWFPSRLGVGPGLTWSPISDRSAKASLTDGDVSVSLTFTFDEDGDPIRVEGLRARATEAGFVDTPWIGTFSDHEVIDGFRIPRSGEVGWEIDGELILYWRGRITAALYR